MLLYATPATLPVKQAFLNWLASIISAFLSMYPFYLLEITTFFPFISFTSTLRVPTGRRRWSDLHSLIKCRTLFLKVCCSHFSLREAGAPNICCVSHISWVIKQCSCCKPVPAQLIWCFMSFACLELYETTQVNLCQSSALVFRPQLSRCQVGFR